jgi:transposase
VQFIAHDRRRRSARRPHERPSPHSQHRQAAQSLGEKELAELGQKLLGVSAGIGKTIALIGELPELGSLDRREIAALVGLAPWTRQSGQGRGKRFIGGGRKTVRSSLFVGPMVAARYNPQLKQFRDKLVTAGKPRLLALVAVARKLILNAILRDRCPRQPLPARPRRQSLPTSTQPIRLIGADAGHPPVSKAPQF